MLMSSVEVIGGVALLFGVLLMVISMRPSVQELPGITERAFARYMACGLVGSGLFSLGAVLLVVRTLIYFLGGE
jgi:hypothetical protein